MLYRLDLYRRLIGVQMRSQLQYRAAFLLDTLTTGFQVLTAFVTLALILQRFDNVGGWRLPEVAFLYGMVEMAFGSMDMLFSGFDPDNFSRQVQRGLLDQLMLRPIDITLQVLGSEFIVRRIGRITQGAVVFVIALAALPIHWTLVKVLYLPLVFGGLVSFFGGLFIVGATITIWTVESIEAVNIFTYGGSEMMSYPMHIYPDWMRQFFTYIIPAIFLNYYPALYILDKPDPLGLPPFVHFLAPIAGLSVLVAAFVFWRFGLRHYQSTGT